MPSPPHSAGKLVVALRVAVPAVRDTQLDWCTTNALASIEIALVRLRRANRQVPFDQRVAELELAAREPEPVSFEQGSARGGRPHLLPLADECSNPLLQLLDAGPEVAARQVEGPVVNGGRCGSADIDYPSSAAHARESSRVRGGRPRARAQAAYAWLRMAIPVTATTQPSTRRDAAWSRSQDAVRRSSRAAPGDEALELVKIDLGDAIRSASRLPKPISRDRWKRQRKTPESPARGRSCSFAMTLIASLKTRSERLLIACGKPRESVGKCDRTPHRTTVEKSPCGKGWRPYPRLRT
jgi:hypothetical protein